MEQLSLFDFMEQNEDETNTEDKVIIIEETENIVTETENKEVEELLEVGQIVMARKPCESELETDCETYYYLKNFQNKEGKIIEVNLRSNPVAYHIDFRIGIAVLSKSDLVVVK